MLTVGDRLPPFRLNAVVSLEHGREHAAIAHDVFPGKWIVLFFWPLDFTFVCPTEIASFGAHHDAFAEQGAVVLGASTDSEWSHLAWRKHHPALRKLPFPMLADVKRELATALGILDREAGVALRATFIVDPEGTIRWVCAHGLDTGRSVPEVLRALAALRTGGLTACDWTPGQATLDPMAA